MAPCFTYYLRPAINISMKENSPELIIHYYYFVNDILDVGWIFKSRPLDLEKSTYL